MLEAPNYLVELNADHEFLTRIEDGFPYGCPYPSAARHMTYAEADELCRQLREQGYLTALVTDRYGRPVSATDLKSMLRLKDKQLYSIVYNTGEPEDLWFLKQEDGKIVGTPNAYRARQFFLPVAAAIVEDLRQLGFKAKEVKVYGDITIVLPVKNDEDVRQSEPYRDAMGVAEKEVKPKEVKVGRARK